jgi:hypothetical protein
MSKKMMLLALAVVSAAAFVLPAGASAQEIHLTNVTSFSGTFDTGTLTAKEEPTITCGETIATGGEFDKPNHVTGTVNAGGTTGNITLDFTACHTTIFGITAKCHTEGSPADNTISSSGVFHLITFNSKPAILVTPVHTTVICAGISNTTVTGNVIGTITSPACGVASNSMTIKFEATGPTQTHKSYTGVNYNLTSQTGTSGTIKEAGLANESTTTSATAGTLDCT